MAFIRKKRKFAAKKKYVRRTHRYRSAMTRIPHAEVKYLLSDITGVFGSVGTTWLNYDPMGQIQQGVDASQRIGRIAYIKSIEVKGTLAGGATDGGLATLDDSYNLIRLVVFHSHYNEGGAVPALLAGYSINLPLISESGALGTLGFIDHIWRDKTFAIQNHMYANLVGTPGLKTVHWYIRFRKPMKIIYNGTGSNQNQQQLMVCALADSNIVPHPGFISGFIKTCYIDP